MNSPPYLSQYLSYTSPEDCNSDVNPFWMVHPVQPGYQMPLQPNISTIGTSSVNTNPFEPSSTTTNLEVIPSTAVLDKDTNFDFSTLESPSTHMTSADLCTTSPSGTAASLNLGPECTLCNRTFSSQDAANACFLEHLIMKPFPCFGACGDTSW
jgi:hypothetical protein